MFVLSRKSSLKSSLKTLCFVLLIVAVSLSPALKGSFLNWDDDTHVYHNPLVQSLELRNIKKIFTTSVNDTYIPLTILSFALEYQFFGFNPLVYHLDNLLLHLAVVVLIVVLALRFGLSIRAAFAAALLFGIHPMHVESVVWVTERKDVLYSFFYLLALIEYCKYLQTQNRKKISFCLLFGLLSIFAKPMALSLPLILFLFDWHFKRPWTWRLIREKIPIFLFAVPISWLTYSLNARIPGHHFSEAVLVWIWTFSFYLKKFIWPVELIPYYVLPKPIGWMNPEYVWAALIFMVFIVGLATSWRRHRWFAFAALYYFLSIFFLLRFDQSRDTNIVADRFMYLPSLGFCFLLGMIFDDALMKIFRRGIRLKTIVYGMMLLLTGMLCFKTYTQSQIWKENIVFWNYVIGKNPNIPRAHNHRGVAYVEKKQFDLAIADFSEAIRLSSQYPRAYCNRADTYAFEEKYDLALADLNQTLKMDKNFARAYTSRGIIYSHMENYDLALEDFTQAIRLDSRSAKDYNNRAIVYKKKGEYRLAMEDFSRSILLNPRSFEVYINRAKLYELMGQVSLAQKDIRQADELQHQRN